MRGPQAMMRTPLMIESPSRPGTDQRDLARRRLASAELWSSVNRRPSIHSADSHGDEQLQAILSLVAEPRAVSCFMAEWIEPPAYLKVHTASNHFLGNGKIRRFGCSLLFSGVARVTHGGLHEAL